MNVKFTKCYLEQKGKDVAIPMPTNAQLLAQTTAVLTGELTQEWWRKIYSQLSPPDWMVIIRVRGGTEIKTVGNSSVLNKQIVTLIRHHREPSRRVGTLLGMRASDAAYLHEQFKKFNVELRSSFP